MNKIEYEFDKIDFEAVMREAVADAMKLHQLYGRLIPTLENGQIQYVMPEEILRQMNEANEKDEAQS